MTYLQQLEEKLDELGSGYIATVCGRYWAMDRAKHHDRTERAWRAFVLGSGDRADSARQAIEMAYTRGESDEFIQPVVIGRPKHLKSEKMSRYYFLIFEVIVQGS